MTTNSTMTPKAESAVKKPAPTSSNQEARETARVVGFVGGMGSLITRES